MPRAIPNLLTVLEVQMLLASRLKSLRLDSGLKRTTLALRSGVSARTLQRFEDTGEVSLKNLLRLAHAIDRLPEFAGLLEPPPARSLADLDSRAARPTPKRGRI